MPEDKPAITFATLVGTLPETILNTFNTSFGDYIIPFQMEMEQFIAKLFNEDVQMELSVGAFSGNELVGLILHGKRTLDGKLVFYNALTGVVPSYRNNNLTEKMYKFALGVLKPLEPHHLLLEVIEGNHPAIKAYGRVGYDTSRYFKVFKGPVPKPETGFDIQELTNPDWEYLQTFWDCRPSWQNDTPTLQKPGTAKTFGVMLNGQVVGYIAFNPHLKRIIQIAVKHGFRGRGIGKALIAHLNQFEKELTIVNIDTKADGVISFFQSIGWANTLNLYEMAMPME